MKKNSFKSNQFRNLRQAFMLLVLVLAGALTSCELLPGEKECPFGGSFTTDILLCNTPATAEQVPCSGGEFGNIWLKLDDGTYLQPYENATHLTALEAGKRYRIGFDYVNTTRPHSNQPICLAVAPPSKPIKLQCIMAEEPDAPCDTYATATNIICGYGAWNAMWLKLDNGKYLQPWDNQSGVAQLVEGKRYKVGFRQMAKDYRYNNQAICLALPNDSLAWHPEVVSITCLQEAGTAPNN